MEGQSFYLIGDSFEIYEGYLICVCDKGNLALSYKKEDEIGFDDHCYTIVTV
jgi:hypothetical protein